MTWGIINEQDKDALAFLSMDRMALGFDSKVQAEDFADDLDEPGEWAACPIPPGIPVVMVT
jgi:hypothetical protein